ncbi:hypothetical protein M0811_01950 [Anaeramoeba ignava]|uniref:Uncharacterized protein n=1 Tax=Anaeramoeba ignava TaxID=1746090 RepID=A0A9Q0LEL6_ANAIG|nr:hypothetical protein M0811_01950 [Anaeramoeba ignava]
MDKLKQERDNDERTRMKQRFQKKEGLNEEKPAVTPVLIRLEKKTTKRFDSADFFRGELKEEDSQTQKIEPITNQKNKSKNEEKSKTEKQKSRFAKEIEIEEKKEQKEN